MPCIAGLGYAFVPMSQPTVGQTFAALLAGHLLSAYNLDIFAGVFAW